MMYSSYDYEYAKQWNSFITLYINVLLNYIIRIENIEKSILI